MRNGCDVTRNSFSVRPQMAGKGQGVMETDAGVAVPFPDLSALLSCCDPVRFAGFGATLDGSTPLVSVLSHLLPVGLLDPKGLEGDLQVSTNTCLVGPSFSLVMF